MPHPDLRPAIQVCTHCPHLAFENIEVLADDGRTVDTQAYWWCRAVGCTLFFDDGAKNGAYIELETDLPQECPYTLEQALNQKGAGRERWVDLAPLLKNRI